MIAEICFTADRLERKRKELKGVDPSLLERAFHANPEAFWYWYQASRI